MLLMPSCNLVTDQWLQGGANGQYELKLDLQLVTQKNPGCYILWLTQTADAVQCFWLLQPQLLLVSGSDLRTLNSAPQRGRRARCWLLKWNGSTVNLLFWEEEGTSSLGRDGISDRGYRAIAAALGGEIQV